MLNVKFIVIILVKLNFMSGDWGLGIGDCQSPIPNPQSPVIIGFSKIN